jgi:hypothetical protein
MPHFLYIPNSIVAEQRDRRPEAHGRRIKYDRQLHDTTELYDK